MNTNLQPAHDRRPLSLQVADIDLNIRTVLIEDQTPTGLQLAIAAGFAPAEQATVLAWRPDAELEDVGPSETIDLARHGDRFIIVLSDRSYRFTVDGRRFDWPASRVSDTLVRKLAGIDPSKTLYFERQDEPDRVMEAGSSVDLGANGVETFHTGLATWVLNVQGKRLHLNEPTIVVQDAMQQAGFDILQGWHIFLKVVGQPKQAMTLTSVIDLRTPGIEKLRLTLKDVSNGEARHALRRDFTVLEVDEDFLDDRFANWEAALIDNRRWLLIHGYRLPAGYNQTRATLAFEIPTSYPGAQIDMFFVDPPLLLASGGVIAATQSSVNIAGIPYQQWSRHRGVASAWKPESDNVVTHLALVEAALALEVAA